MPVRIKRIYDEPDETDGVRIFVDRLWPRGLSKGNAHVDEWLKEVAPSNSLRKWFGSKPGRWDGFKKRYTKELESSDTSKLLHTLNVMAKEEPITLLFAAKDTEHNNALALVEILKKK